MTVQIQLEADWDEFCSLERRIGEAEGTGLRARWECGHKLLGYEKRQGGASPLADAIAKLTSELGGGKDEFYRRRTFAELYPGEADFSHACEKYGSWYEIVKSGLSTRSRSAEPPPLPDSDYRCITIDPPWPIEKIVREVRPAQSAVIDYATLSVEEIDELVGRVVGRQNGCHVYLWTTHRFVPEAFRLFESWGVKYECLMTWVKNVGPTPFSWMYDTEHVLFGRRGSLSLERQGLRLSMQASAVGHSIKPDIFYERVCEASPGPRLAMFERTPRPGFEVWGDEVAA